MKYMGKKEEIKHFEGKTEKNHRELISIVFISKFIFFSNYICHENCTSMLIDVIRNSVNVDFSQLIRGYKQTFTVIASRCTTKHNKK